MNNAITRSSIERLEPRCLLTAGTVDAFFGGSGGERIYDPSASPDQLLHLERGPADTIHFAAQSGNEITVVKTTPAGTNPSVINTHLPANLLSAIAVDFDAGYIAVADRVPGTSHDKLRIGVFSFDTGEPVDSFDQDGFVDLDVTPQFIHMAWQSQRLLVAYNTTDTSAIANDTFGVVTRLGLGGEVDTTFGSGGTVTFRDGIFQDVGSQDRTIDAIAVTTDLRITIATTYRAHFDNATQTNSIDIYRLTENGNADTSFSGDSKVTLYTESGSISAELPRPTVLDMELRPDGTVATLWSLTTPPNALLLPNIRYISTLDPTGGHSPLFSGVVALPSNLYAAKELEIESGGRYILAGSLLSDASGTGPVDTFVARFTKAGALDTTYGTDGIYKAGVGHFSSAPRIIVQANDDNVLAATAGTSPDFKIALTRLLADEPTFTLNAKGTLILTTGDGDDNILLYIRSRDGRLMVWDNTYVRAFPPSKVKRIAIFSNGGDDTIRIEPTVRGSYADAGDGNDTINGGALGDVLLGGTGSDAIFGNDGDDILLGGGGNDYLLGGAGKDDLFGNGGRDTLSGAGSNDRLFGGPDDADIIRGGAGTDSAAYDALDTVSSDVESILST